MALPSEPTLWIPALDPADELDYQMYCRGTKPLLETTEEVASYSLAVSAEAAALGLTIMTGSGRDPALMAGNDTIKLWFAIDPDMQADDAFSGGGTALGIELTIVTNSTPARTRQRTWVLTVRQQ